MEKNTAWRPESVSRWGSHNRIRLEVVGVLNGLLGTDSTVLGQIIFLIEMSSDWKPKFMTV